MQIVQAEDFHILGGRVWPQAASTQGPAHLAKEEGRETNICTLKYIESHVVFM